MQVRADAVPCNSQKVLLENCRIIQKILGEHLGSLASGLVDELLPQSMHIRLVPGDPSHVNFIY